MNSTEKYIADNKKVFSIQNRRKKNHTSKPKSPVGGSFFNLFKYSIASNFIFNKKINFLNPLRINTNSKYCKTHCLFRG